MANPTFVPIGFPNGAAPEDTLDQRVGLHLLDALDSLDAVYKAAGFFAEVASEATIGEFTLSRCLEAVRSEAGALFLTVGDRLLLSVERNGAGGILRADEVLAAGSDRCRFYNGPESLTLLTEGCAPRNILVCPIKAGSILLGLLVALAPETTPFITGDVKLVGAVASQAAIALGRARFHREAEIERHKLRLLVDTHPDGIVVLEPDGRTTLCNVIARDLIGSDDVLPELLAVDPTCTLADLSRSPSEREVALRGRERDLVVAIKSRVIRSPDDAVANIVLTLRDVTRLRREERLNRNFVSLISHKLRTPLAALTCALEMLEMGDESDRAMCIAEMTARTHDLGSVVDRLFDFTDLMERNWSTSGSSDLRDLRGELEAYFTTRATGRGGQLVFELDDDATRVAISESRLRVALVNLIDNAIKFTTDVEPWVRIGSRRVGDAVVIEVEDRGPGIPKADQADTLNAFHQVDADFTGNIPGAGIGLAMVREIARRLDGNLELREAEPHGCIFSLTLPRAAARAEA